MVTKTTSYFHATYLFDIALLAAKSREGDVGAPTVAVVFCAMALEAFINECGRLASTIPTSERQKIVEAFESVLSELEERKEAIVVKYHLGLLVFAGAAWDEGAKPFQDFKLLLTLRNEIAHMKGDAWESEVGKQKPDPERRSDQYPKWVREFRSRKLIPEPTVSTSWLEQITTPKVALWACRTASTITSEFYSSVPEGSFKESLKDHLFLMPGAKPLDRVEAG